MELLLFRTMGLATALQPMIVAGARRRASTSRCWEQGRGHAPPVPRPPASAARPSLASPAGISSLWMVLGWNYYTAYAVRAEPTMSEDITVTQKDD